MEHLHWRYFLALERDFVRTVDYVELATENANAFSNEFAKLLLLCGSEIDVVAKLLCGQLDPHKVADNIMDYRSILIAGFPGIHTVEIGIPRYQLTQQPWLDWGTSPETSPSWWKAYNKVKHERDRHFAMANQANTLSALCGLLALLLYYHREEQHLQPYPVLLEGGFPSYLVTEDRPKLPGVP